MAQLVKMPDGVTVSFPDDLSREEIGALIADKFPQEVEKRRPTGAADYAVQGLSGANEGLAGTLGLPVDLANQFIVGPAMAGINAVAGTDFKPSDKPFLGSESIKGMMGGAIAPESDRPELQMTRRVGQEFGAAAPVVGGLAAKAAKPVQMLAAEAGLTAASGAGAAAAQQADPDNPWLELAAQFGASAGAASATRAVRKAITPNTISPTRQTANKVMKREGVDLTAGQATGNKRLQYTEAELGGYRVDEFTEKQAEQFTKAVLKRAGISANRATTEVLDEAFTRMGDEFDDLATRTTMPLDRQLGTDLRTTLDDYRNLTGSDAKPIVENLIGDLVTQAQKSASGTLDGTFYKTMRSRIERAARGTSDPELKGALRDLKDILDDAIERGMTSADDIAAWKQVRNDYRNMIVIEQAATAGGANAASGLISPAALRQATVTKHGRRNYARGNSDFAELARAGVETMTPLPQSGTAPRAAVNAIKGAAPFAGAALGGGGSLGMGAVAGAAAGAAAPSLTGRAILSGPGRRYLTNQVLPSGGARAARGAGPATAALVALNDNQRKQLRLNALN